MTPRGPRDLRRHVHGERRSGPTLGPDAALVSVPEGTALVVSTDTLLAGVHFFGDADAADVGYKCLAVNLSDLAAMGARPSHALLTLAASAPGEAWLAAFGAGVGRLAATHGVEVSASWTQTGPGPLVITVEALGHVPPGEALTRSGAGIGDLVYVTGTLGDAGLALAARARRLSLSPAHREHVETRLARAQPRLAAGRALRGVASAAIDVSDGLAADLGHILTASRVGATLHAAMLPLSDALRHGVPPEEAWGLALCSGDDYELCVTVPPGRTPLLERRAGELGCDIHRVGVIEARPGLRCLRPDGTPLESGGGGYRHFG